MNQNSFIADWASLQRARDGVALDRRPTGIYPLDQILPGGGLRLGSVVELIDEKPGFGAGYFCLLVARQLMTKPGYFVVVEQAGRSNQPRFYAPLVLGWGIDPCRLMVIRASQRRELLWAMEQALRCPAVRVCCGWLPELPPVPGRRLQLAAESGEAVALLLRPAQARGQPSWADIRLTVRSIPTAQPDQPAISARRRLQIEILRARSAAAGSTVQVDIDNEGVVSLVSPLARSAVSIGERGR